LAKRLEQKKELGLHDHRGQGGGVKPRLNKEQKEQLKQVLTDETDFWTCGEIRTLVQKRFSITYSKRQIQRLLRLMGMFCYKPQPRDYRQSPQHRQQLNQRLQAVADVLGMGTKKLDNIAIGFADESTFQLFSNSARMWSFHKERIRKVNTTKTKQNCFGFYAIRGKSLLIPIKKGNEQTFLAMLDKIKEQHLAYDGIILIWDNHKAHITSAIEQKAHILGISIVNLPTYSPNLNPIERLWKSIKAKLAEYGFIENLTHLNQILEEAFEMASKSLAFAKKWVDDFWNTIFWKSPISCSN
jgi:transposase